MANYADMTIADLESVAAELGAKAAAIKVERMAAAQALSDARVADRLREKLQREADSHGVTLTITGGTTKAQTIVPAGGAS